MARPPRFPSISTHQTERSTNDYRHFDESIRADIQEFLKSESLTEGLKTVKAVLDDLTLVHPSSQSRETQLSLHGTLSDPSPDESEPSLTPSEDEEDAESVTTIDESLQSLRIEPLTPITIDFDGEERLKTMVQRCETYLPSGCWPEYKKMARSPGHIIYGLKIWMVDGVVHYSRRHKHATVLNDEEWDGLLLGLSSDFWTTLLRTLNDDEAWDSFGYWTPPLAAGKDPCDWDLYWFLVHRNADYLWWILMGIQQAPYGRFHLHFQTEFDGEFQEEEKRVRQE